MNGKIRDKVTLPFGVDEDHVRQVVLNRPRITELLAGKDPKKLHYVPGRIFSIVV